MPKKARASDMKPAVGRRLKAARSIIYDSADGCAKKLGIHKNTWRNYEEGGRYPDPWNLVLFCDTTGFTTDFVYRGRLKGIEADVQLRLAAAYPELVDEAPDVGPRAREAEPA